MAKARIYWNRFQIKSDRVIFEAAGELLRRKLIVSRSVDKNHVTNITMDESSAPVPVHCLQDFLSFFHNAQVVSDIIGKYHAKDYDEDEEEIDEMAEHVSISTTVTEPEATEPGDTERMDDTVTEPRATEPAP